MSHVGWRFQYSVQSMMFDESLKFMFALILDRYSVWTAYSSTNGTGDLKNSVLKLKENET